MIKTYLVYDGRAVLEGTDEATVLTVSDSLEEAREEKKMFPVDSVIYSYDEQGGELINEEFVE